MITYLLDILQDISMSLLELMDFVESLLEVRLSGSRSLVQSLQLSTQVVCLFARGLRVW